MKEAQRSLWEEHLRLTKPMLAENSDGNLGSRGRVPFKSKKTPVIGIKQRGGELRFFHAED